MADLIVLRGFDRLAGGADRAHDRKAGRRRH